MSSSYYNPQVSRWEPILEKIGFDIEVASNQNVSPKFAINLEINESFECFNITVSTQMLNILLKTINLWSSPLPEESSVKKLDMTKSLYEEEEKLEESMIVSKAVEKMGGSMSYSKTRTMTGAAKGEFFNRFINYYRLKKKSKENYILIFCRE